MQDARFLRMDPNRLGLRQNTPFPVQVFANDQVPIESVAVDELLDLLSSHDVLERLHLSVPGFQDLDWAIEQVAITPDFHKGAGVPIGTVIRSRGVLFPQAVGKDINCGMRLHATSLDACEVVASLSRIESTARHLFFEGGRQIPMTRSEREALLTSGLSGVCELAPWTRNEGQWSTVERLGWHRTLDRVERRGSLPSRLSPAFADWTGRSATPTYDDQIGSIGGGNHFVELQRVERILDRQTAFAWGLKKGALTIMVHSGSAGIGHIAGRCIQESLKGQYPAGVQHPENGIYPLRAAAPAASGFWDLLHNAANFAFANRMFLAACAVDAIGSAMGTFDAPLVYDAPHNLVWKTRDGSYLHRKGATPARGPEDMAGTPFAMWGEPVLVPGSMGSSSFVLAGLGNPDALESASHGAGRALSRGQATRTGHREFEQFLRDFRVVTPLDLKRPDLQGRSDIARRRIDELRAEGPHAYKGVHAIVDTLASAGIAKPVAELTPVMTIKG
jgi:tRNA-splicing ligase RtcB (3'-phosphate/5'-hydroxy nucleic acid ligase)